MAQDMDHAAEADVATTRVVGRFVLRLVVLAVFALASSQPFWAVLTTLLMVSCGVSAVIAGTRREPALGSLLTHWDEAAWYALLSRGVAVLAAG